MRITLIMLFLILSGCGIFDSEYKNYDPDKDKFARESCDQSVAVFQESIATAVNQRCIACHVAGGSAGSFMAFTAGADKANAENLKVRKDGTAAGIYNFLKSHTGKASVSPLTQADFAKWLDAEAACP